MSLLETVKQVQTRSIEISLHPSHLNKEMIQFFEKNLKQNPGKSSFKNEKVNAVSLFHE